MARSTARPAPRGIAVAVVFDWALAAQLVTQAIAAGTGHLGLTGDPTTIAARVAAGVLLFALGEGVRRGVRPLRVGQAVIVALVTVLGIASAAVLVAGHGSRGLVASTVIELTVAPYLLLALLSRGTVDWFAAGRARDPAPRTAAPAWLLSLALQGLAWGVGVAWSQSL